MVHSQRHVNSNSPCLLEAGGVLLLLLLSAPLSQEPLDVFLLTFLSPPHFPLLIKGKLNRTFLEVFFSDRQNG